MFSKFKNTLLTVKSPVYLFIGLIILAGSLVRLPYLHNIGGLEQIEVSNYFISSRSFPFGILKELATDALHAPFYYFVLYFWIKLFGSYEITLRLLSFVIGLFSIFMGFLAGKELKDKCTGYYAAILISFNSIAVFFSAYAKFYGLLFLLGLTSVYFLLKIVNNLDKKIEKKALIGFVLTNLAIIYTYMIGFIFVFFEAVVLLCYVYRFYRDKTVFFSKLYTLKAFFSIPVFVYVFSIALGFHESIVKKNWGEMYTLNIARYIDFSIFSPVLYSYPLDITNILSYAGCAFLYVPLIYFTGFINSFFNVRKDRKILLVVSIALMFLFIEGILIIFQYMSYNARHLAVVFGVLLLITAYGLSVLSNRMHSILLLSIFIGISVSYNIKGMPETDYFIRTKPVKVLTEKYKLSENDRVVIFPIRNKHIHDYYKIKPKPFNFNIKDSFMYSDIGTREILLGKDLSDRINRKNAYSQLKPFFESLRPSDEFYNYFYAENLAKLKKGQRLAIIFVDKGRYYKPDELITLTKTKETYEKTPLFILVTSKIFNDMLKMCENSFSVVAIDKYGGWNLILFEKK